MPRQPQQTPTFTHDCTKCEYLGTTLDASCKAHDWYVCDTSALPTVIARYGDEGREYWSTPQVIVNDNMWTSFMGRLYITEKYITARYMLAQRKHNEEKQ
jgi:3-methyladenine DNA glycosylase AlkD